MSNYNTFLIKRRSKDGAAGAPSFLSGGELAFNEANKTLYYGTSVDGVISIGGEGAFVTLDGISQTISGPKVFTNLVNLSSVTFDTDSVIDINNAKITNLPEPTEDSDATTLSFVNSVSSALQSAIDNIGSGSNTAVENLSTEVYNTFVEKTESEAVVLNGGLTVSGGLSTDTFYSSSNASVGGNLTVTGNLSVLGTNTVINTQTINISGTSTQIDVVNNGSATGITVNQTGDKNVAEFYDDSAIALAIVDGGNIGIGTLTPNEKLTVVGNISATGTFYSANGLEISSGAGATTLFVEDEKVGINTETPNEALTVVGSVSATLDIYARNGDFTGTLDVDGATTLGSTLYVTDVATFASSVSAAGAVDFDSTLDVVGATTLQSTLDVTSVATFASTVSAAGAVTFDNTLYVAQNSTFFANISGQEGVSTLINFIIDGGVF